jgi:hypothetical protein
LRWCREPPCCKWGRRGLDQEDVSVSIGKRGYLVPLSPGRRFFVIGAKRSSKAILLGVKHCSKFVVKTRSGLVGVGNAKSPDPLAQTRILHHPLPPPWMVDWPTSFWVLISICLAKRTEGKDHHQRTSPESAAKLPFLSATCSTCLLRLASFPSFVAHARSLRVWTSPTTTHPACLSEPLQSAKMGESRSAPLPRTLREARRRSTPTPRWELTRVPLADRSSYNGSTAFFNLTLRRLSNVGQGKLQYTPPSRPWDTFRERGGPSGKHQG